MEVSCLHVHYIYLLVEKLKGLRLELFGNLDYLGQPDFLAEFWVDVDQVGS